MKLHTGRVIHVEREMPIEGFWQISSGSTPNQIYNPVDQDRRYNYLYFLSNRKLLERYPKFIVVGKKRK